jgi:glycosyltransferase involved in cell wall biosynthesis
MKLLLANKFFFLNGGAELVFFQERDFLVKEGCQVIDFAMAGENNLPSGFSSLFPPKVDFHAISGLLHRLELGVSFIHSFAAAKNLQQLIDQEAPQLAHLHNIYHQLTPAIIHVLKRNGIPIVMTLHDYKLVCPSYLAMKGQENCLACDGKHFLKPVLRHCQNSLSEELLLSLEAFWHKWRKSYEMIDHFIAPSRFAADVVSRRIPADKISVIHNGVATGNYVPNYEAGQYILYFGRLSSEKGVEVLAKAHQRLPEKSRMPLKIAGTGPLQEELKKQFPAVEFIGYKKKKELKNLVAQAAIIVVPSTCYENCSMAIIEAMALGKPVVGSNIGGIPEQIDDGVTGLLFKAGDHEELAEKLAGLQENPNLRKEMGRAARRKLEEAYSMEQHGRSLLSLFKSMLQ